MAMDSIHFVVKVDQKVVGRHAKDFLPVRMRIVPEAEHHFRPVQGRVPVHPHGIRRILAAAVAAVAAE